jgi:hypothetical protein
MQSSVVNLDIKKSESKVVDTIDIEDVGDKKVFCRCWRSATVIYNYKDNVMLNPHFQHY